MRPAQAGLHLPSIVEHTALTDEAVRNRFVQSIGLRPGLFSGSRESIATLGLTLDHGRVESPACQKAEGC